MHVHESGFKQGWTDTISQCPETVEWSRQPSVSSWISTHNSKGSFPPMCPEITAFQEMWGLLILLLASSSWVLLQWAYSFHSFPLDMLVVMSWVSAAQSSSACGTTRKETARGPHPSYLHNCYHLGYDLHWICAWIPLQQSAATELIYFTKYAHTSDFE